MIMTKPYSDVFIYLRNIFSFKNYGIDFIHFILSLTMISFSLFAQTLVNRRFFCYKWHFNKRDFLSHFEDFGNLPLSERNISS